MLHQHALVETTLGSVLTGVQVPVVQFALNPTLTMMPLLEDALLAQMRVAERSSHSGCCFLFLCYLRRSRWFMSIRWGGCEGPRFFFTKLSMLAIVLDSRASCGYSSLFSSP
mmetsp:Transcript_23047/g.55520  ORF Transcript_23047/g.55520 Transcript_23047/m.55520 type:complete len:112 (+) Transcript_23047:3426-3761(+)